MEGEPIPESHIENKKNFFNLKKLVGLLSISLLVAGGAIIALAIALAAKLNEKTDCNTASSIVDAQRNYWLQVSPQGPNPGERLVHAADGVGDNMYIHGGFYGFASVTYDDLWQYNEPADTWTLMSSSGDTPSGRGHHSFTFISSHEILMFGGFNVFQTTGQIPFSDLYHLDVNTKVWTRWDTLISGNAPPGRGAHDAWFLGGSYYVFGGWPLIGAVGSQFHDLWRLDLVSMTWTNLTKPEGPTNPNGRYGTSTNVVGDKVIMFGGGCEAQAPAYVNGQCNDLWTYSWQSDTWAQLTPGNFSYGAPMARRAGGGTNSLFGMLFIYGGVYIAPSVVEMFSDMWAYDPVSNKWFLVQPNWERPPQPPGTFGHSLITLNNRMVLFGGRAVAPTSPGTNQLYKYTPIGAPV